MRSVFFDKPFSSGDLLSLPLNQVHHLRNVLRSKIGTETLVLDGNGLIGKGRLKAISKRNAEIEVESVEKHERQYIVDLFLGCPKKEYFEEVCRCAVELGIDKVWVFESQNSPWFYQPYDRLEKILKNSLLQSNNPFLPKVKEVQDIFLELNNYTSPLFLMSPNKFKKPFFAKENGLNRFGFIVGPEGGFTTEEERLFLDLEQCSDLFLPTPILKTVTAVPAGFGHLCSLLKLA